MNLRLLLFCFLFLLINDTYSQFWVNEFDGEGEAVAVDATHILKNSMKEIDSIILSKVYYPDSLYEYAYNGIMGNLFYSYVIENDSIVEKELLRGIDHYVNKVLYTQSDIIIKGLIPLLRMDPHKKYQIIISLRFDHAYPNDTIYIQEDDRDEGNGYRRYVFSSREPVIIYKSNSGPEILISIDSKDLLGIMSTVDDCIMTLDELIDEESKERIKVYSELEFLNYHHDSFGFFLGEYWELESDSDLAQYFNKLGVQSIDAMIEIILTSYYRHLKGEAIELNEQVQFMISEKNNDIRILERMMK